MLRSYTRVFTVVQAPQVVQERRVSWAPMLDMPYKEYLYRETIWALPWIICWLTKNWNKNLRTSFMGKVEVSEWYIR